MADAVDQLVSGLDEIKQSLKEISSCLTGITTQLAVHERRIETLEREHKESRAEQKTLATEVRSIHETCVIREDVWRRGRELLENGEDPQTWWNRMVSSGVMAVIGAAAGGAVAAIVGKYF